MGDWKMNAGTWIRTGLVVAMMATLALPEGVSDEVPKIEFSGLPCAGAGKWVTRPSSVPNLIPIPGLSSAGDGLSVKVLGNYAEFAYFDLREFKDNLNWYLFTGFTQDPAIDCDPFSNLPCDVPYLAKVWDWVGRTEEAVESGNLTAVPPPPEPDPAVNCGM